jgi:hypothetical protein
MRLVEFALMGLPALFVIGWLMGLRHARFRFLALIAGALAVVGGLLFWMGDERGFTGHYTPARWQDGRVTSGQGS